LFYLSFGLIFSWKLAPLQRKIYQPIKKADANNFNQAVYHSYLKQWERWGLAAMLAPLGALILMVMKIPVYSIF
jgi:hypothetical protein